MIRAVKMRVFDFDERPLRGAGLGLTGTIAISDQEFAPVSTKRSSIFAAGTT
jgi:hypothetical protein